MDRYYFNGLNLPVDDFLEAMEEQEFRLVAAHRLYSALESDSYYFLPEGEEVELYHQGSGEPPYLRATLPVREARSLYRELLSDGYVTPEGFAAL